MSALTLIRRGITRVRSTDDRGITLAELLVAMTVLAILMTMVIGFFASASKAFQLNQTVDANTRTSSNTMNEMSRMLRAATNNPVVASNTPDPAFVALSATATSVTFYAFVNLASSDQTPVEVRFALNTADNTIVESRWSASLDTNGLWVFPKNTTVPTSTRILGGPVLPVSAGGPQLFTYLASDGTTVAFDSTGVVPVAGLATIASVEVSLTFGTSTAKGKSVALQSVVGLPNLGIARTQ